MKRLTRWKKGKWLLPQGRTSDGQSYWIIITDRLAEYEYSGLTPEEVMQLKKEKKDDLCD